MGKGKGTSKGTAKVKGKGKGRGNANGGAKGKGKGKHMGKASMGLIKGVKQGNYKCALPSGTASTARPTTRSSRS